MSLKFGFFDSVDGDRVYSARDFSAIFNNLIRDGVLPKTVSTNQFAATPATSGLGVKIDSGWAWFDSTYTHLTSAQTFVLDAADAVLYRWDAIVIETDAENRENSIKVVKGTPAAEGAFVKPTLTANQHPLCYAKVTPGLTSMVQGNIENRVGLSDCPFITGVVGTADLTQVFAQWEYDFDTWFDGVVDTLSGDVAGNLLVQIQANKSEIEDIEENQLPLKVGVEAFADLVAAVGTGGHTCRIAYGNYVGTGGRGSSNRNSVAVDFYPIAMILSTDDGGNTPHVFLRGQTSNESNVTVWTDTGVSWYCTSAPSTYVDPVALQFNASGVTYFYAMFGYSS